ncbi:MAG TPA: cysteine desulfurase family protein [Acidiferrobacterales bacterium]|jgi:cysteine desulfurase
MHAAVYLDHNATTPVDDAVLTAMLPFLREHYGNPSSVHRPGRTARAALERAREQVAALVGAHPAQVIFTAGGTEANSLALRGVAAVEVPPGRIAVSAIEHPSVAETAEALGGQGWLVARIPVDSEGRVTVAGLEAGLDERAVLASVMWANNETGVIQDIAALSTVARERGVVFHTDAVQALGKLPVDFAASGAQLMSLSAHKIYGPKGVGALIVDKAVDFVPQLVGGGQEKARRAGTENVAGIVGFGAAAELARERLEMRRRRALALRERLTAGLRGLAASYGIVEFSASAERLPNTCCFAVPGVDGETLVLRLDQAGVAVSSGSACASGSGEPSPVLLAMGIDPQLARGGLRVSLGEGNTEADVDAFLTRLAVALVKLVPVPHAAAG